MTFKAYEIRETAAYVGVCEDFEDECNAEVRYLFTPDRLLRLNQRQVELLKLLRRNLRWAIEHHIATGIVLREGDVVADRLRATEE